MTPNGSHFIEIGGSGYTDAVIYFSVSNDCKVSPYKENIKAAVFGGNVITFKNVQIEVDPQEYGGDYTMKGFRGISTSRSNTFFTVVPNVGSFLEVNGLGIGAVVYFKVEESGHIIVDNGNLNPERNSLDSAYVDCNPQYSPKLCNTLTLKNIKLKVEPPQNYTVPFQIGTIRAYSGIQELIVIPNLLIPILIAENAVK